MSSFRGFPCSSYKLLSAGRNGKFVSMFTFHFPPHHGCYFTAQPSLCYPASVSFSSSPWLLFYHTAISLLSCFSFIFCLILLAITFLFGLTVLSSLLSYYLNHQITLEMSCPCTICVPNFRSFTVRLVTVVSLATIKETVHFLSLPKYSHIAHRPISFLMCDIPLCYSVTQYTKLITF